MGGGNAERERGRGGGREGSENSLELVDADGGGAVELDGVDPGRVLELGRSDADLDRGGDIWIRGRGAGVDDGVEAGGGGDDDAGVGGVEDEVAAGEEDLARGGDDGGRGRGRGGWGGHEGGRRGEIGGG